MGLCSPPPCVKDDTREVEGALSRLERVLASARGPERRTDRRSARRHLCREDVGYERVYSPTPARSSSRSRVSAWRAPIRAHQTRAPRQGEARAPQSGYARASSPHAQGPGGLPLVLLDCSSVLPSRARTQEGPLGARRWRSPPLASGQYVAGACAPGGGEPFRPLVALSHMRDSAGAVIEGACSVGWCMWDVGLSCPFLHLSVPLLCCLCLSPTFAYDSSRTH